MDCSNSKKTEQALPVSSQSLAFALPLMVRPRHSFGASLMSGRLTCPLSMAVSPGPPSRPSFLGHKTLNCMGLAQQPTMGEGGGAVGDRHEDSLSFLCKLRMPFSSPVTCLYGGKEKTYRFQEKKWVV